MNTVDVILTATGFLHFSSGRGVVTQESGPRTRPVRVRSVGVRSRPPLALHASARRVCHDTVSTHIAYPMRLYTK
jgi:hypothetical protein